MLKMSQDNEVGVGAKQPLHEPRGPPILRRERRTRVLREEDDAALQVVTRARGWCFTVNNYTPEDYGGVMNMLNSSMCKYGIVGKERGANGTPHLQGYVYFKNMVSRKTIARNWLGRAWLTSALGTPEENREYCMKDNDFVEYSE